MNFVVRTLFILSVVLVLATPLYREYVSEELSLCILCLLMLGVICVRKVYVNIGVIDLFCVLMIVSVCCNLRFWNDEMYTNICVILILWSLAKFEWKESCVYILIIIGIVYILISFSDIISFSPLSIQWVIDNSGIMGIYLSLIYPLVFGRLLLSHEKWKKYVLILIIVVFIISILLTESRSAFVAATVSMIYLLFKTKNVKFIVRSCSFTLYKRIAASVVLVLTITVLVFFSFNCRVDSIKGRILIYEVAVEMASSKPLLGYGANTFGANYLDWQRSFFERKPDSSLAIYADNTNVCLNEYLHIWCEFGLLGEIILFALMIWLFRMPNTSVAQLLFKASLLALITASFFSYPLRRYETLLVVVVIIGVLFSFDKYSLGRIKRKQLLLLGMPLLMWFYISLIPNVKILDADAETNITFVYEHAVFLSKKERYEEANYYFRKSLCYMNSYNIYLMMGRNCECMGQIEKAKYYYQYAHCMVPNRFLPLYRLMLLWQREQLVEEAVKFASEIISKEIKVPSYTVSKIKYDANELIRAYSK